MKRSNFQMILIVVFIAAAVFGLLVFSGKINLGKDQVGSKGTVTLWGTVDVDADLRQALDNFNATNPTFTVNYIKKSANTFEQDLLDAFASNIGPDMFFMPEDLAYSYRKRIVIIPYKSFPIDKYQSAFASAGDVFLTSQGIMAFPIAVDPMVMYYNKSMLDANNIVYPPQYWDQFAPLVPTLTVKDDTKKIIKSTVALGQFTNITHAKDVLAALFMQTGNKIVSQQNGVFLSNLANFNQKTNPSDVLKFYTDFTDPLNDAYSWNRSLQDSRDAFSSETLTFYFGFASELKYLQNRNPNEDFAVAPIPQIRGMSSKIIFGRVTGIAVSAFSRNLITAYTAAGLISTSDFGANYARASGAVPIRRDLLATKPSDPYSPTFYSSALYARSWVDPSPKDTDNIFRTMVENVLSNDMGPLDAVNDASGKMSFILAK